jgi:hypothetical protein
MAKVSFIYFFKNEMQDATVMSLVILKQHKKYLINILAQLSNTIDSNLSQVFWRVPVFSGGNGRRHQATKIAEFNRSHAEKEVSQKSFSRLMSKQKY